MVSRLHRALRRDLWHLRGQVLATALLVACGVGVFTTMRGTYRSLVHARREYYAASRFADVFAHLRRAPIALTARLRRISGVAAVQARVVEDVTLTVPGLSEPATGRLISLPDPTRADGGLDRLHLTAGRLPAPYSDSEALVSQTFADANDLSLGARIGAVLNGRWKELTVVGFVLSPEYIYEVGPAMVFPDNRRFGVLWMNAEALSTAFQMKGAFNDLAIATARGASEPQVIETLDRLLAPYGGLSAYGRDEQPSNRFLSDELAEIEVNATYIPAIFLGVAAFLVYTLLARLVSIQRGQIGLLKSFGFAAWRIGAHYLEFALLIVSAGLIAGVAAGGYFGGALIGVYQQYFHFPALAYRMDPQVLIAATLVAFGAATMGSLSAVARVVRLAPAEAMHPEPPRSFRPGLLDSLGLTRQLDPVSKSIARNLARRPWRATLSVTGIALALATVVVGRFIFDAVNHLMATHFDAAERQDVTVVFQDIRSPRALASLRALPGVLSVEPFRIMPVRLRAGHRSKRLSLVAVPAVGHLYRIVDARGKAIDVPPEGVVLTRKLAQILGVRSGDRLLIEQLDGRRRRFSARIVRLSDEPLGISAYMDSAALATILGEDAAISGARLKIDTGLAPHLYAELKRTPAVAGVSIRAATVTTIRQIMERSFIIMTTIMTAFGIVLVIGVVYNSARIALSERGTELASLRVLGFTRSEVTQLLLGEQAVLVLAAIPAGCLLGALICRMLVPAFDRELFRLPFILTRSMFAFATLVTLGAAALAAALVGMRIAGLDLIAVLKSRE